MESDPKLSRIHKANNRKHRKFLCSNLSEKIDSKEDQERQGDDRKTRQKREQDWERREPATLEIVEEDVVDTEMVGAEASISVVLGVEPLLNAGEEHTGVGSGGRVLQLL